jgi:hypothetical protein
MHDLRPYLSFTVLQGNKWRSATEVIFWSEWGIQMELDEPSLQVYACVLHHRWFFIQYLSDGSEKRDEREMIRHHLFFSQRAFEELQFSTFSLFVLLGLRHAQRKHARSSQGIFLSLLQQFRWLFLRPFLAIFYVRTLTVRQIRLEVSTWNSLWPEGCTGIFFIFFT